MNGCLKREWLRGRSSIATRGPARRSASRPRVFTTSSRTSSCRSGFSSSTRPTVPFFASQVRPGPLLRGPRVARGKRHKTVDCPSVCPVDRWQAGLLHAEVGRGQQISIIAAPAAPTCGPRNFWSDCKEVQRRRFA